MATEARAVRIIMPPLLPWQRLVHRHPARFKVLVCGRRSGKTQFCAAKAVERAATGGIVWWVAPTYDVGTMGWRKIERLAKQIPWVTIKESAREIHFPGGGFITIRSADGRKSLRGEGIDLLIIDETADVASAVYTEDLRASLSDKRGDLLAIGTPKGRMGLLYDLFGRGKDASRSDWMAWQLPSWCNPIIDKGEFDDAKAELPEWVFNQEYGAQFVVFAGKVYKTFDPLGAHVFNDGEEGTYTEHFGAIDPGFTNPCAIGVAGLTAAGRLDFREEVYESGMLHEEITAQVIRMHEQYGVRMWWSDPADPALIAKINSVGIPCDPAPRREGLYDSWVKNGIIEVEKLICADPVLIRFHKEKCPSTIHDFDRYRYPKRRDGASVSESPLKVDDHGCDMARYLVVGLQDYMGAAGDVPMGFGRRISA